MKTRMTGQMRLVLSLGALGMAGLTVTAAALSDSATVLVQMDSSQNRFDLDVAGNYSSEASTWEPTADSWQQGNPDAYRLPIGPGQSNVMSPGSSISGRIAVRNNSPRLAGLIELSILDPQARGDVTDPQTGNFQELFEQLIFTVKDGDTVIFDHVPATQLSPFAWNAALPAGGIRVLDVRIEMSPDADNRWQMASTDVQFNFSGVTP
ncbi:hypothetical protein AB6V29_08370 [Microbacterium sp. 20-116]|uniref:hypothetical protein n=1 Tax=Microbacterium sp. 20-116 TaxID=3239883 RepID=UPI0034E1A4AE